VHQFAPHHADLVLIFLLPTYRRQGIGKEALEKLKKWLRKKRITHLRIEIEKNNNASQIFFQKNGAKIKSYLLELKL